MTILTRLRLLKYFLGVIIMTKDFKVLEEILSNANDSKRKPNMFAEKLDFLIQLCGVTNSSIARACAIDPSLVSRLRRGKRKLPSRQTFLPHMAMFFARKIKEDWQLDSLSEVLNIATEDLKDNYQLAEIIEYWLLHDEIHGKTLSEKDIKFESLRDKKGQILSQVEYLNILNQQTSIKPLNQALLSKEEDLPHYYYGVQGKQEAVLRFLAEVLQSPKPLTLYLFSDEVMTWMHDDKSFSQEWTRLFLACLKAGNHVIIIHDIQRNIDEMIAGVRYWIPFYGSGQLESHYFPNLRDQVFHSTIFIAKGKAAIISSSIGDAVDGMLHYYLTDPSAIAAEEKRYINYLAKCDLLFQVLRKSDQTSFWRHISEQLSVAEEVINFTAVPSFWTIKKNIISRISERNKNKYLSIQHEVLEKKFINKIQNHPYVEVLPLSLLELEAEEIQLHLQQYFSLAKPFYQSIDLAEQLEYMADLLGKYPNYSIQFMPNEIIEPAVFASRNYKIILYHALENELSFVSSNERISSAFWTYIQYLKNENTIQLSKDATIRQLQQRADRLRQQQ